MKLFPMVDEELLNREPDSQDNPYFVMEHILACREHGLDDEEWHDEYTDKVLTGFLKDSLDTELGISKGTGKNSDHYQWTEFHRKVDMLLEAAHLEDEGLKFTSDIATHLADKYNYKDVQSVINIFYKKGQLPSKRRTRKAGKK